MAEEKKKNPKYNKSEGFVYGASQKKVEEDEKKHLQEIRRILDDVESNISRIKHLLFAESFKKQIQHRKVNSGDQLIVEGVFDGENMIDQKGKKYSVPANYASKSKLVCGDVLKLTMPESGPFIFKQIGPIERRNAVGILEEENGKYYISVDEKKYNVLLASVTYFKAKPGDKLAVILPLEGECDWTAIENII